MWLQKTAKYTMYISERHVTMNGSNAIDIVENQPFVFVTKSFSSHPQVYVVHCQIMSGDTS